MQSGDPITIALVNDYDVVVQGLNQLFEGDERFRVLELEAGGLPDRPVEIALYDTFADEDDTEKLRTLVELPEVGRVVVYSWTSEPERVEEALAVGAAGFVSKQLTADQLKDALIRVHAGERVVEGGPEPEPEPDDAADPGVPSAKAGGIHDPGLRPAGVRQARRRRRVGVPASHRLPLRDRRHRAVRRPHRQAAGLQRPDVDRDRAHLPLRLPRHDDPVAGGRAGRRRDSGRGRRDRGRDPAQDDRRGLLDRHHHVRHRHRHHRKPHRLLTLPAPPRPRKGNPMPLAPVEYAVIAFDGTSVTGEVAPAEVAEAALSTHLSPTDAPTSQEPA